MYLCTWSSLPIFVFAKMYSYIWSLYLYLYLYLYLSSSLSLSLSLPIVVQWPAVVAEWVVGAAAGRRRYWKCACTLPHHLCKTIPTQIILVISENFHQLSWYLFDMIHGGNSKFAFNFEMCCIYFKICIRWENCYQLLGKILLSEKKIWRWGSTLTSSEDAIAITETLLTHSLTDPLTEASSVLPLILKLS